MSILKPTSSIKIVRILITALLVLCSLLLAVRSAQSNSITINAAYQSVDYTWSYSNISSSSIAQDDTYTCHAVLTLNTPISDNRYYLEYANIITSVSGGGDLEYYIKHRYSGVTLAESDWQPVGTPIYLPNNLSNYSSATSLLFYVRRVDGQPLSNTDIASITGLYAKGFYNNEIVYPTQTTAIPPQWLDTTTASIPELTTYTTVATTVPYEGVLTTLTIPADIRPAIAQFEQIVYDLWNLHYMPFVIIFGILVGLAAWLLH